MVLSLSLFTKTFPPLFDFLKLNNLVATALGNTPNYLHRVLSLRGSTTFTLPLSNREIQTDDGIGLAADHFFLYGRTNKLIDIVAVLSE